MNTTTKQQTIVSPAIKKFKIVKIILNKSIFDENVIHMILKYYWQLLDKCKVLLDWIDIEQLSWKYLSKNPNAIYMVDNEIDRNRLSKKNKNIVLFSHNLDRMNWCDLSKNPNAIHLLENNLDKINWFDLSKNPNAIHLLENNLDKINWDNLSLNPNAIELLTNNQDKIDWDNLCLNPNAIHLLKENQDEIDWYYLSSNPSIFEDEPMPIV